MNPPPPPQRVAMSAFLLLLLVVVVHPAAAEEKSANYLVYVDPSPTGAPELNYHLSILAAALGSEDKAKLSIKYDYKNVVGGFSATLTPPEVEALRKQPQVTIILPSKKLHLMSSNYEGVS